MENKKYELTEEKKEILSYLTVYRIRALKDFTLADGREIKKGELGGWIKKEENLSHEGNCWVMDESIVGNYIEVYGDTVVDEKKQLGTATYARIKIGSNEELKNYLDTMKYEFTGDSIKLLRETFGRIRALKDFTLENGREIKKGDLGGWISSPSGLSQDGNCWVCEEAMVNFDTQLYGSAVLEGKTLLGFLSRSLEFGSTEKLKNYLETLKYELTGELNDDGDRRIRSLKDFTTIDGRKVKKGDLGGWINSEMNLSHEGRCWVFDNARAVSCGKVYGDAVVKKNATVGGYARVYDRAIITGSACVWADAYVHGNAMICDNATIKKDAEIFGRAHIGGNVIVDKRKKVYNGSKIENAEQLESHIREEKARTNPLNKKFKLTDARMELDGRILYRIKALRDIETINGKVEDDTYGGWVQYESNLSHDGNSWIFRDAKVFECGNVSGDAVVFGEAWVYENAKVCDHAQVEDAHIKGHAIVKDNAHFWNSKYCIVQDYAVIGGNASMRSSYKPIFVCEHAEIAGNATINTEARIRGNAKIGGDVRVHRDGPITLGSDAVIESEKDLEEYLNPPGKFKDVRNVIRIRTKYDKNEEFFIMDGESLSFSTWRGTVTKKARFLGSHHFYLNDWGTYHIDQWADEKHTCWLAEETEAMIDVLYRKHGGDIERKAIAMTKQAVRELTGDDCETVKLHFDSDKDKKDPYAQIVCGSDGIVALGLKNDCKTSLHPYWESNIKEYLREQDRSTDQRSNDGPCM